MDPLAANARIAIQRATTVTDEYGDETEAWTLYAEAFAQVRFGSSQERREAAQEVASQTATFVVLWSPTLAAVTPQDRISWNGEWDVTGVAPSLQLNDHLEFTAVRRAT